MSRTVGGLADGPRNGAAPRWHRWALLVIAAIQTTLLVWSARIHSPTWDEPGHLVAGLSHWHMGRFDLYSVNPPLVRTISSAPVYFFMNPVVDWSLLSTDPALRSEVNLGRAFVEDNGLSSFTMFLVARLTLLPIALLGSLVCYLFARDLFSSTACGLLAATLWAFSPDTLAYGSVITPDLATAVAGLGCSYLLWRYLQSSNWQWLVALGGATGLAMLCKSIWLVLPMVYALVLLGNYWFASRKRPAKEAASSRRWRLAWLRPVLDVSFATVLALLVVNTFYGFRHSFQRLDDYTFVSHALSGEPIPVSLATPTPVNHSKVRLQRVSLPSSSNATAAGSATCPACALAATGSAALADCESCQAIADGSMTLLGEPARGNRFRSTTLGRLRLPLPARYVEGIDVQRRDFEAGLYRREWASYLGGQWRQGGWWYFYLLGLLLKTPEALLALVALAVAALGFRRKVNALWPAMACLFVPAAAVLVLLSVNTGLTRYLRYALPAVPVLAIVASAALLLVKPNDGAISHAPSGLLPRRRRLFSYAGACVVALLIVGYIGNTLASGPHWLSYFNSLAGGPQGGQQWFADSNVDWGQDLKGVKSWLDDHPEAAARLNLAYFGGFSPASVGIAYQVPAPCVPSMVRGNANDQQYCGPLPGWYIVSKNYLVGHPMPVPAPDGSLKFFHRDPYAYFSQFEPVDRIGHSMLVYHLRPTEVNAVRLSMGMAPIALPTIETPATRLASQQPSSSPAPAAPVATVELTSPALSPFEAVRSTP